MSSTVSSLSAVKISSSPSMSKADISIVVPVPSLRVILSISFIIGESFVGIILIIVDCITSNSSPLPVQ